MDEITERNSIDIKQYELLNQIIEEEDHDKLEELTNLFKSNQKKKELVRIDKLGKILDLVDTEVYKRLYNSPSGIEDKDLVGYLRNISQSMKDTKQSVNETPLIQINNQSNNVTIQSGLDQDQRKRVLEVAMKLLNSDVIEGEFFEEENEEE